MAGDPSKFPEQLRFVQPWRPKRLVWNRYSFGGQNPSEQEKATLAKMEIGEYNAILGKSYSEIAGLTRSMHKSQGMGVPEERGKHINYFQNIAGDPAKEDVLEGVDLSWKRVPGGERVGMVLEKAYRSFRSENPSETVPALLEAYKLMDTLARDPQVLQQKKALLQVLMACSGMWLEAIAAEPFVIPGTDVKVNISALNRSDLMWQLQSVQIGSSNAIESPVSLKNNLSFSKEIILKVPPTMPYTQPYWLERQKQASLFQVSDQRMIGLPESPAPFVAKFRLVFGNQQIEIEEPVLYRWVDPVQGERYRTFEVLPEVSIHIKQPVVVFTDNNPKTVSVLVKSEAVGITGELTLKLPNNWSCDPKSIPFRFTQKNETLNAAFVLRPSQGATNGSFLPLATVGGKQISSDVVAINYEHFPPQTVLTSAEGILLPLDLKKSGQNIGYIMGSGDQVPESLEQAGYRISLLSDEGLVSSDLSTYDAIVLGIRAYNTRPQLMTAQTRLVEYVRKGGTMVVQYNTVDDLVMTELGPYPLRLSRDRVSVQDSPVTILATENPLLNFPNKITAKDFEGWVQERGLYFPDQWDPRYETLIACSDPGESPQAGGILYTHYGKGVYIYTSYSWFRELPAGVPGAYRLFVNLVSAGK
jgi:hypothetical protein